MDFEQIYRTYFQDVFLYIRRLSNDAHIAEEITSETFFKAMRTLPRFRGDCNIRVWLCQIAKNSYYSYLRKSGRTCPLEDPALSLASSPPDSELSRQDEALQLRQALHTLPEPYREVLMWRLFADMSFRQIGQIFGKSENWACVTCHRARTMLKERWENENEK